MFSPELYATRIIQLCSGYSESYLKGNVLILNYRISWALKFILRIMCINVICGQNA